MEIESVLLALVKVNDKITGYELNCLLRNSDRYFLTVSLSYIYPILKKLHKLGLVDYANIPMLNRPDKKAYSITTAGEEALAEWLKEPIQSDMYSRSFLLKMQFAHLMDQETILAHIEREIAYLENRNTDMKQLSNCYNSGKLEPREIEVISSLSTLLSDTNSLRIEWLKDWQRKEQKLAVQK